MCATTLALLHRGRVVLAVIDAPFLAQRYRAIEGKDAFTGTTALTVSNTASFHDAVVALGDHAVGDHADRKNGHSRRRPTLTAARRSGGRQSGRPPGQRTSHRQEDHSPHREALPKPRRGPASPARKPAGRHQARGWPRRTCRRERRCSTGPARRRAR